MATGETRARRDSGLGIVLGVGLGLAAALAAGSGARAQDAGLKWQFHPGESLHYRMDQKNTTEIKFSGQDITTSVDQTIDTTWAVKKLNDDGSADFTQTIDRIKSSVKSPLLSVVIDSDQKDAQAGPAASMLPVLKALVKQEFKFRMSPQGELSDVEIPADLVRKLKEAGQTAGGAASPFSEEGLKMMIQQSSLLLPASGKPLTRQSKSPLPFGTIVTDKTYTDGGEAEGMHKVTLGLKVKLEPNPENKAEVKIGSHDGGGVFFFDTKNGRVDHSEIKEHTEMVSKINDMDATQVTTTTTNMKLVDVKGAAK